MEHFELGRALVGGVMQSDSGNPARVSSPRPGLGEGPGVRAGWLLPLQFKEHDAARRHEGAERDLTGTVYLQGALVHGAQFG